MYTLGLKLVEPTEIEKKQIEIMISTRDELRTNKQFTEADEIRRRLSELYSVEIIETKIEQFRRKLKRELRLLHSGEKILSISIP
jgi:cysteinyl-tRNA synthetase